MACDRIWFLTRAHRDEILLRQVKLDTNHSTPHCRTVDEVQFAVSVPFASAPPRLYHDKSIAFECTEAETEVDRFLDHKKSSLKRTNICLRSDKGLLAEERQGQRSIRSTGSGTCSSPPWARYKTLAPISSGYCLFTAVQEQKVSARAKRSGLQR